MNDLYTEVQNLEKSNISLMNEISRMKKRELFILNGKDPDEISTFRFETQKVDSETKPSKVPALNLNKIEEWREKEYLASLL